MVEYNKVVLENGLTLIHHFDKNTPIVAMNILYKVGARDEDESLTGFAHLFEHLMFGGSENIPVYDEALEKVGGENNAFTNNDLTNYYLTLPIENVETAFWLESDRMLNLAFSDKSLEVQRNVVVEEYKQRYLNQPYGDIWLLLRPLVYKKHSYKWATIGKEISHIENATMDDVRGFYSKFYNPDNAILVVAGPIEFEETLNLTKKWFEPIKKKTTTSRIYNFDDVQNSPQFLEVERDVPVNIIYKVFKMCDRLNPDYYAHDLLSDILSNGKSSRLYQKLFKKQQIFTNINAYISGDHHPGVFVVSGHLSENTTFEHADKAIMKELVNLSLDPPSSYEMEKIKNKIESTMVMSETNILDKAMNLAYYEFLGDAQLLNNEIDKYRAVKAEDITRVAKNLFVETNCSTLYYKKKLTDTSIE